MGTARNRPRASSSPYFAIHSTIIHFTQCKKTLSRKHKSDAVFCGQIYGQICRKYCFVRFLRAVYTKKFTQNTKGDVWQHFSRLFCHRRAQRFLEGTNLEHRNPELTNLQMSCSRDKTSSWAIFKETYHCKIVSTIVVYENFSTCTSIENIRYMYRYVNMPLSYLLRT